MVIPNGKTKNGSSFLGSQDQPAWLVEIGDLCYISLRTGREEHSPATDGVSGLGCCLWGQPSLPTAPLLAPGSHTLGVGTLPPTRWPQQRLGSRGQPAKLPKYCVAQWSWDRWEQGAWSQLGMAHSALRSRLASACTIWLI